MSIINNSKTDPNKILPMTYLWARQHYKDGVANNWVPEEIPMQDDIEQWKNQTALTEAERRLIYWNLGFFSTAESLTANNIVLAVYNHVTNPECRQYLLRQAFEEAIHTDTFIYCCDSLGLNPEEIYTMYQTIPSIKEKDDFVVELTKSVFDPNFNTIGDNNVQAFVHDLVGYYVQGRDHRSHQEGRGTREDLRPGCLPRGNPRDQQRAVLRLRGTHRRPTSGTDWFDEGLRHGEPLPVDEPGHGPLEGEEFLRDPGHGIPNRRPGLGLGSNLAVPASRRPNGGARRIEHTPALRRSPSA